MTNRARVSQRQRVAGEAGRRAASAARLARTPRQHGVRGKVMGTGTETGTGTGTGTTSGIASGTASGSVPAARQEAGPGSSNGPAESVKRPRRLDAPDRYPYAAIKQTLHRAGCRKVEQSFGSADDVPEGTVLDVQEAAAWVGERVGPRGGLRYRLCGVCEPETPAV
ncbi:hypothetical protein ACIPSE_32630 [Streptomyces sp. NPDC090106]|uniref:hypothetical protein n=1 Tax=Streptomyces sp. NPDC090106 TaxID=3365946 RepID=UPI00382A6A9A